MAAEYRDRDYAPDYSKKDRGTSVSWLMLLLVPLFFLFGWVANDYFVGTNGPEAGIGGAPAEERVQQDNNVTNTDDGTNDLENRFNNFINYLRNEFKNVNQ